MILLTHAFSRRNAGDGLLVELAIERLQRVGVSREEIVIVALDPESFGDDRTVIKAPGDHSRRLSRLVVGSLGRWISGSSGAGGEPIGSAIADSRAVIGVGGGYLRAGSLVESVGALVNHGHQLAAVASAGLPSIYLPQSVGPLGGPIGRSIGHWLSKVDHVCVRDEESLRDLEQYKTGIRIPDMAILAIAERLDRSVWSEEGKDVVLVARRLPRPEDYGPNLSELFDSIESAKWAIQADVAGAKDDGRFVRSMGYDPGRPLSSVLSSNGGGVVVSVRLHGALDALLRGWPAIHLCYNRKGIAAYRDLGLSEYAHDARTFDPAIVRDQVLRLLDQPHLQRVAIEGRRVRLVEQSDQLTSLVAEVVNGR